MPFTSSEPTDTNAKFAQTPGLPLAFCPAGALACWLPDGTMPQPLNIYASTLDRRHRSWGRRRRASRISQAAARTLVVLVPLTMLAVAIAGRLGV